MTVTPLTVFGPEIVAQGVETPSFVNVHIDCAAAIEGATPGGVVPMTVAVNVMVLPRVVTPEEARELEIPYALSPPITHALPAPVKIFLAVRPT